MPSGNTTTSAVSEALPQIIDGARLVEEYEGWMPRLCEKHSLPENTGLSWDEDAFSRLTASSVTEVTVLDNPQQIVGTLFSVSPTVVGIQTLLTERTLARVSKNVLSKFGPLAQRAIQRRKDIDGLVVLDTGISLGTAGSSLTSGILSAGTSRSRYGAGVERPMGMGHIVLQGFQLKDVTDEVRSGIGTYPVPDGPSAEFFRKGWQGTFDSFHVWVDDNITIDSSDDAKGGVFTKDTIVLVQGRSPWTKHRERPDVGGGAEELFLYDEFAYGVRLSNSLFEIYTDALAPSS